MMVIDRNENLISLIESAFSNAPKPTEITVCPCEECQELQLYFNKFDPTSVSVDDLRRHETLLFHGTSESFRYFLPYFLIASVEDLDKAGAIPDLILRAVSTDFDIRERTKLLNRHEVDCINRFFDFLVESENFDVDEVDDARKTIEQFNKQDNIDRSN